MRTRAMEVAERFRRIKSYQRFAMHRRQDKDKCMVQQGKQREAKAAIREWTESEDCQEEYETTEGLAGKVHGSMLCNDAASSFK